MKKYFILLLFLAVMILPAEASADFNCLVKSSCNSGEVSILELSGTTNAHAGLPGSGYPYAVCCSGVAGLGNSCSGNFEIVAKLSGASNAHVRQGDQADYPGSNNVCLSLPEEGTVEIGYQLNNCAGFDTTVASMSAVPTNAHIGDGDAYVNKICASASMPRMSSGFLPPWLSSVFGGKKSSSDAPSEIVVPSENANAPASSGSTGFFRRLFGSNKSSYNATTEQVVKNDLNSENNANPISDYGEEKNQEQMTDKNNSLLAATFSDTGNFLSKNPLGLVITTVFAGFIFILARRILIRRKSA